MPRPDSLRRLAAAVMIWTNVCRFERDAGGITIDDTPSALTERQRTELTARRALLTVLERSEHIAEWVRLTDEKNKVAQLAPPAGGKQPRDKGINAAARELGIDRTEAQRSGWLLEHPTPLGAVTTDVTPPTPARLRPRRNPVIAVNSAGVAELHDPNY